MYDMYEHSHAGAPRSRTDVNMIVHVHPLAVMAVGGTKEGLLPVRTLQLRSTMIPMIPMVLSVLASTHCPVLSYSPVLSGTLSVAAVASRLLPLEASLARGVRLQVLVPLGMLSSCAPTDICVACPCVAPLSYEASFEHALSAGFANGQRAMILNHHGMYAVGRDAAEGVFVATHLTQAHTRARASSSCALAVYLMCAHARLVSCFRHARSKSARCRWWVVTCSA
jgi:hypothetical protein